ncbi:hypothetical protein BJV78DRAFT_1282308 [Lactifluus subvellereus]|nr:hypothetical protein BJV78DRAFT_1282308 [Lactifluus subvellereus]
MAQSHPSNNPSPTDPAPREQEQEQEDDNDEIDDPSLQHIHTDVPPARPSTASTPTASFPGHGDSSEGYPSWLPKRPPPPAPGSTLHSISTANMFSPDVGAPATDVGAASSSAAQTPVPFIGGRKPTPRSVRIVSLQDSNAVAGGSGLGVGSSGSGADRNGGGSGGGGGGTRRRLTDQTTRVSSTAPPPSSPRFLRTISVAPFSSFLWSRATAAATATPSASALGGRSPTLLSSSQQTPDARLRAAIAAPPKFRSPGLHLELLRDPSWKTRLHFYIFPVLVFAHLPLQTFLDFNAVFVLIQVAKFPNPDAPGVPGSGRNWVLGAIAYIACWIIWIFGVFLGYELIYSFYRRWRFRRPLILPIYLSSPAFNLVAMTSYTHFCFLQHIRTSAFPRVNPSAVLPSAEGSLRDALAETCYFYAQNLPTIVTLLPRAGLALALLLSFFNPVQLPGGLSLSDVDQAITQRDGTFFNTNTGALSGYAKGVLIANAAWAAWRTLVLLLSCVGLWIFSGYGCAGLCGPRSRWEEAEIGRTVSLYSEKSDVSGGPGDADTLPWSWKECTLLRVLEAYEFCLTLRAPRTTQTTTAGQPSEGGFDGIEKVFAAVGIGGATQPLPARRGMLSQDLFEIPSPKEGQSRRSSQGNGHGIGDGSGQEVVVPPLPEARVRETSPTTSEGGRAPLKDLPYPFTGFGPRESSEQEQIPFPPSPGLPVEGEEGEPGGEVEGEEGDIVVRVEEEAEGEGEEEEETRRRTSEDPSSFSGRASNSLSSLGQPIPSRYPFSFRQPARGGSMSSTGSPPFAFSRSAATPQSKSTSTRASHDTRSTGNVETASSSGSPVSAAHPSSSAPSPQDVRGMPMPPRHPAAGASGRQRAGSVPVPATPTPAGGLTATRPRQQAAYEEHRQHLRASVGSDPLPESDREEERPSRSGQPSPDGSLEAREREDSVGLLSPPSSQPSPRASLLGSRNGSTASLARIGGAFRSRSRSRHTSSGSASGGTGSGASSRHNSHVSLSNVSRARAQSLIHSIGGASRSSIELVLGRTTPASAGAVRLGEESPLSSSSDASASEGAVSNSENYTFGRPVVGGAGSALPRRAGARAHTLESTSHTARSSVSSSSAAAAAVAQARARVQGQEQEEGGSTRARSVSSSSLSLSERAHLQTARSFASQASPLSLLSQSVLSVSEDTPTSGSARTQTQAAHVQTPRQRSTEPGPEPEGGVPIPQQPRSHGSTPPPPSGPHLAPPQPPADLSTAAASLVTTPPTIASQTTESSGQTPPSVGGMEHYAPPHARTFTTPQ